MHMIKNTPSNTHALNNANDCALMSSSVDCANAAPSMNLWARGWGSFFFFFPPVCDPNTKIKAKAKGERERERERFLL